MTIAVVGRCADSWCAEMYGQRISIQSREDNRRRLDLPDLQQQIKGLVGLEYFSRFEMGRRLLLCSFHVVHDCDEW